MGEPAAAGADFFDPGGTDFGLDEVSGAEAEPQADADLDGEYSPGAVGWSTLNGVNVGFAAEGSVSGGLMPGSFITGRVDLPAESEPVLEPSPIDPELIAAGAVHDFVLRRTENLTALSSCLTTRNAIEPQGSCTARRHPRRR